MRFIITLFLLVLNYSLWSQMPGITASQETSFPNDEVTVTISVDDFEDVVSLQFTLAWDPSILTYQSTGDYGMPGLSEFNFGENATNTGILTFVWFDGQVNGISLTDDTPIFTVTFLPIGDIGDLSAVSFLNAPTPLQVGIIDGVNISEVEGEFTAGQVEIISNELSANATIFHNDCFGEATGSIELNTNGGVEPLEYNWTGPNNFSSQLPAIENLAAGEYTLTITDQNDSTFLDAFTIVQPSPITVDQLLVSASDCDEATGSISIVVSGGETPYSYDFGDGFGTNPEAENLEAGTYFLQISDANTCIIDTMTEITQGNAPVVDLGLDTALCAGQTLLLIAGTDNELTYTWTLNNLPLSDNEEQLLTSDFGVYEVTVSTADNCTTIDQIILSEAETPTLDLGENMSLCEFSELSLVAPGGFVYQWFQDGNLLSETTNTFIASTAGIYGVVATSDSGCTAEDEVQISLAPTPLIDLGTDLILCPGSTSSLFAESGLANYQWFLNAQAIGTNDMELEISEEGIYSVIITNADGCMNTDEVLVEFIDFMTNAGPDTTIIAGDTIQLFATGGETYNWPTNTHLSCNDCPNPIAILDETTTLEVLITSADGCVRSEQFVITVKEKPEVEIDIVNWLSPNGDGDNDVLKFRGLENYNANQLSIYNRWGKLLYSKPNYQLDNIFWDATYNGQPLPAGIYFYVLKVKSSDISFKSSLTIVRD